MNATDLSAGELDQLIRMAWHDRTSFEEINERLGLTEADVIETMCRQLRPSSFRLWRRRMRGRTTKHRKRFRQTPRKAVRIRERELD